MNREWAEKKSAWAKRNRFRLGAAIAALAAIAIVIVVASGGDDSKTPANGAEIVSVNELREKVALQGTPAYWAGERPDTELELSQSSGGRTYVRYLTDGAEAGDPRPAFLTVGTYETADPVAVLRNQGRQPGGVLAKAPGGGTVYFRRTDAHSVYLAYPGVAVQIEVYDPDFKRALRLVNAGQIVPVG
jgi:hypothetical protein